MLVNKVNLQAAFVALSAHFNNAFTAAAPQFGEIAMTVPSNTAQNNYGWLADFPMMKKWVGDKEVKRLAAHGYTLVNDDFEATVSVKRNDIEDDQLGIYAPQAQAAGQSSALLPDDLCFTALTQGFVEKCFDGQYFFDTDHPVGDGVVSNKGTKALSVASLAAAQASIGVGITALLKMKNDEGKPLRCVPNVLVVAPALAETANLLMTTDRLEDGKPNPYKGKCKVVVNFWAATDTEWMLLDTRHAVKPIIYQERKKPVFVSQTDMNADDVFMRAEYKFGAEARAQAGYGFWQMAYGSTGTT